MIPRLPKKARVLVAGLLVLGWLVLVRPASLGGPAGYVRVTGVSMEPTIHDGDFVLTRAQNSYLVGDIVAFDVNDTIVIHRIVGGSAEEGFVMQGDNKDEVDTWRPKPQDVLGERWLRIPGLGRKVQQLQASPAALGAVAGGLGVVAAAAGPGRRRRRSGGTGAAGANRRSGRVSPPRSVASGFGVQLLALGGAAVLLSAATVATLARPAARVQDVKSVKYTHTAGFEYTATVKPSTVYGSATVSSHSLAVEVADVKGARIGPPLFTKLLLGLEVEFAYALESSAVVETTGRLTADLRIQAGDGWAKTIPALEPREFGGRSVSATIPVDVARVRSVIAAVEAETGTASSAYQLVVVPRVELTGQRSGQTVAEAYAPEFSMDLSSAEITVNGQRAQAEPVEETSQARVVNNVEWLGVSAAPAVVRGTIAGALVLLLVLGGVYVGSERKRLGRGELARIRLRYGSLIVPLTGDVPNGVPHSEVTSMGDLVRLARRNEQLVFHDGSSPGEDRFFVPNGTLTYEYRVVDAEHQA